MASKLTFLSPFRRFLADERGAFAVMFGVMAIVLVALGGAVVDYVTLEQGRNRAQLALDAAALALQPRVFEDDFDQAEVQELAQAFLNERIGRSDVVAEIVTTRGNEEEGSLYFQARIKVPTIFVALVGVPELDAAIESEATRKKLALEVVMVLDNSGSMKDYDRMKYLKLAAQCAANTLFYDEVVDDPDDPNTCIPAENAQLVENVKIGIVPFTMFVNVGNSNKNAAWLDTTGASSLHYDNFDNDDDETRLILSYPSTSPQYQFPSRMQLFAATGQAWRGCVEARPHTKSGTLSTAYLDTDDTAPAGGDTLFVPLFSPDLVNGVGGNNYVADSPAICDRPAYSNTTCQQAQRRTGCNASMNNNNCTTQTAQDPVPVGPTDFYSDLAYTRGFYGAHAPSCSCRTWSSWTSYTQVDTSTGSNRTFQRTRNCVGGGYVPTGLSNRELQERVCKYYAGYTSTAFSSGPNADCTRTPILPLTSNPADVEATIENMTAEGGTNIHEGTVWGFRALSPGAPFTEGAPYEEATSKVLIIMTDGENTAYNLSNYCGDTMRSMNGNCYNSAYGFPYNSGNTNAASTSGGNIQRMGPLGTANANLVTEMNTRTSQACANAKDPATAGIAIYTIGLSTDFVSQSTPATVRAMLTACASSSNHAKFPENPSELKAVFAGIANELSALRLAL
ncbi:hypothetical protein JP75_13430 [Devosia riboflavina]|uniref:Putative Flp pilus-assembly TadG-like N-terminal domain-containing protein n=1 Tax=Devosia riboflavina TaxID=46914 RepID=A0A087M1H9_9HYPH|nr:pilus assembly protein TadG-related protein [Devosia riboflavina]KFL30732.1 hypothetical protein JP75_13430 [Devosia riboflavina]